MKKAGLLFMVALLAFGMSLAGGAYAQGQKVVRITLIDQNGSGEDGSAQLTDLGDGTVRVELIMMNAPEGAVQPAHIHKGSCTTLDPNPAFPLTSVTGGKSTTVVTTTLAALTKDKYAVNVHESATNAARYVACGNLPSAATLGGTMTLEQAMSALQDQANELAATLKNNEADASKSAFTNFRSTFTQYKEQIKGRSADAGSKIETAMNAVNNGMGKGDSAGAATAADALVAAVKNTTSLVGGSSGNSPAAATSAMSNAIAQMQSQAQDMVRETANADKANAKSAYDVFNNTFSSNADMLKAQNTDLQANIAAPLQEVSDALAVGDYKKANSSSTEIQTVLKDFASQMGVAPTNQALPKGGAPQTFFALGLLTMLALGLASAGLWIARKAERG